MADIKAKFDAEERARKNQSNVLGLQTQLHGQQSADEAGVAITRVVGGQAVRAEAAVVPARRAAGRPPAALGGAGVPAKRPRAQDGGPPPSRFKREQREDAFDFGGGPPERPVLDAALGADEVDDDLDAPHYWELLLNQAGDVGREISGAQTRVDSIASVKEKAARQLEVDCMRACMQVKTDACRKIDLPGLKSAVRKLTVNEIEIPPDCVWIYATRITSEELDVSALGPDADEAIDTWAQRCVFGKHLHDWDVDTNSGFDGCAPTEAPTVNNKDPNSFRRLYHSAVFGETFTVAWNAASTGGEGPALLIKLALAWLHAWNMSEPAEDTWEHHIVGPVFKVMRGILAMRWAMPAPFESSLNDVLYLCPDKRTSPLSKDVWGTGKVLIATTTEDKVWTVAKEVYKTYTGPESTHGPPVWLLYLQCLSLPQRAAILDLKPIMDKLHAHSAVWVKELRPGVTYDIERRVCHSIGLLQAIPDAISKEDLRYVCEIVAGMVSPAAKSLHVNLLVTMKETVRQDSRRELALKGTAFLEACEVVKLPELLGCIQGVGGTTFSADERSTLESIAEQLPGAHFSHSQTCKYNVVEFSMFLFELRVFKFVRLDAH